MDEKTGSCGDWIIWPDSEAAIHTLSFFLNEDGESRLSFPLLIGLFVGGAPHSKAADVPEEQRDGREKSLEATFLCYWRTSFSRFHC